MSSNATVDRGAEASSALDSLRELDLSTIDVAAVPEELLGDLLATATRVESQAAALRGAVLAEADRRQTALRTAASGTDAWAVEFTGDTREMNAGGLRIARLLEEKYHATRDAFAAGRVTKAQVRVIVNAAEQSPTRATALQVAQAEELILGKATGDGRRNGKPMDPKRLRQAARRMYDRIDHDLADEHEAIMLGRESKHAQRDTYLMLSDNGDGTWSGRFTIPEMHGHLLTWALDKMTAPRRQSKGPLGQQVTDESAADGNGWLPGPLEKRGSALCELIEHLPTTGWQLTGGGSATTLLVRVEFDDLVRRVSDDMEQLGVGRLDNGVKLTAAHVQRLACEAEIVPTILDSEEAVMFHGRGQRLHDRHQRNALGQIHDSCAISGCERPFAWCEIHHPYPWAAGGGTDITNAVPLCGWHHQRAHDGDFDLRRDPPNGPHAWKLARRRPPRDWRDRAEAALGAGYTVVRS